MKCGIVTVYNSENCGSFLQAYALTKAVESVGNQAVCVRHHFWDHPSSKAQYVIAMSKLLLKRNYNGIKLLNGRKKAFRSALGKLQLENSNDSIDCYILGSDTVWDLARSFFYNHRSFFWGMEFGTQKVISYAASLGYANADTVKLCKLVPKALENMAHISVRENKGKEILQPYTGKEIHVVCDPTLLLTKETYEAIAAETEYKDCVFIYNYGKMPKEYADGIKRIAESENLKTVVFGNCNPWCDVSLPYDPFLFLGIMKHARYVVTNTFHGTVFSHILEKRFAVVDCEKVKVADFLKKHGTSDKCFNTAADIEKILKSEFDYEDIRARIQDERKCGMEFLTAAIEG